MTLYRTAVCVLFMFTLFEIVLGQSQIQTTDDRRLQKTSTSNQNLHDHREEPVLLSLDRGRLIEADLIRPHPTDTDATIVEIDGVADFVKLDTARLRVQARKFDEYSDVPFNDEKARLDVLAIELQSDPMSRAYLIAYGTCVGQARGRLKRTVGYLTTARGIDQSRVVTRDGGCRVRFSMELWIVPADAAAPTPSTEGVRTCPNCTTPKSTNKKQTGRR